MRRFFPLLVVVLLLISTVRCFVSIVTVTSLFPFYSFCWILAICAICDNLIYCDCDDLLKNFDGFIDNKDLFLFHSLSV